MTTNTDLHGKVVLVTGAGSGLGAATARAFAQEGCGVACVDVDRAAAERVSGAVMAAMGRDRASVYVPRQYRALDWIAAASPRLATWVVERGMTPCGK